MATVQFVGTGTILGRFTIDDALVSSPRIKGEARLYTPFPYPTLEVWRRGALSATASITEVDTQVRTTVLYAHSADMGSVFFEVTNVNPAILAGHYNFQRSAVLADKDLAVPRTMARSALAELKQLLVPDQYLMLIQQRLESETFNHRVAGLCAAVYFAGVLLEEAEAIT